MLCESLRPVIRQFLDDLLDEKDYQEVHGHLENCARCHAFASSVGTLSYQLYELGQVTVPPDIATTVSYHFSQKAPMSVVAETPSGKSSVSLSGLWKVLALLGIGILGLWVISNWPKQTTEKELTVVAQAPAATAAPKDPADLLAHWSKVNRHYHLSKSSQPELVSLLSQLGVPIEHESAALIVFNVPQGQWPDFVSGFEKFSGVVKEFGEPPVPANAEETVQVSIFLE